MDDRGLALQAMLNKKAIHDEDPENVQIDGNIADKLELQDYEVRRRQRKAEREREEALRQQEEEEEQKKAELAAKKAMYKEAETRGGSKKRKGSGQEGSSGQSGSDAESFKSPRASEMTLVTKGT